MCLPRLGTVPRVEGHLPQELLLRSRTAIVRQSISCESSCAKRGRLPVLGCNQFCDRRFIGTAGIFAAGTGFQQGCCEPCCAVCGSKLSQCCSMWDAAESVWPHL